MSIDYEARAALDKHNAVCAERYANIMKMLETNASAIISLNEKTASLTDKAAAGAGALRMVLYIGSAVAGGVMVIKTIKELIF